MGWGFLKAMADEETFSLSLCAGLGVALEKLFASAVVLMTTAGEEVPRIWMRGLSCV
jgi:hypothetical protein